MVVNDGMVSVSPYCGSSPSALLCLPGPSISSAERAAGSPWTPVRETDELRSAPIAGAVSRHPKKCLEEEFTWSSRGRWQERACPGRITALFPTGTLTGLRAGEASRSKERLSLSSCLLQLLGVERSTGGGEGELSFLVGLVFTAAVLIVLSGGEPVS